jgi:hypothetical protein
MPTSWGSDEVNGQLVPRAPSSAFYPLTFSAMYTGPGMWPKQGTYQVPPVVPSAYMTANAAPGQYGNASQQGFYGSGTPMPTSMSETGNPWHPTKSPLLFALIFLTLGLFGLHYIHW